MKNRLKVLRAERDWTQADLAERLDVSRQTINAIEKGKFDPSLPLAFKAARLFELAIEDIFQDALIALYENAQNGKLDTIKSSLKTYLFSISKFMLFKKFKSLMLRK